MKHKVQLLAVINNGNTKSGLVSPNSVPLDKCKNRDLCVRVCVCILTYPTFQTQDLLMGACVQLGTKAVSPIGLDFWVSV